MEVRSPEFVTFSSKGRVAIVHTPEGVAHLVDLILVSDLEFPGGLQMAATG